MSLKHAIKTGLLRALEVSGAELMRDRLLAAHRRLPAAIVVFHRVSDQISEDGLTVSTTRFRWILRTLREHYHLLPLSHLVSHLEQALPWPPRTVAVTFDDGYRDNFEFAAPILAELAIPATFFITAGAIGTDRVMFWDEHLRGRVPWMDWDQVRAIHAQGFEIGSHTMNHADLGRVGPEQAWQELTRSKAKLEDELGAEVTLFAYPFGRTENMNEENRALVREAGYRCCCSCCGGFVTPQDDPFRLKRTPMDPWFTSPVELHYELRRLAPWRWLARSEPAARTDRYLPGEENRAASSATHRARTS